MPKDITSIFKGSTVCAGNTLCWYPSASATLSFSFCITQFCRNCTTITWKGNRKEPGRKAGVGEGALTFRFHFSSARSYFPGNKLISPGAARVPGGVTGEGSVPPSSRPGPRRRPFPPRPAEEGSALAGSARSGPAAGLSPPQPEGKRAA